MSSQITWAWHKSAVAEIVKVGSALARQTGDEESTTVQRLFQQLSLSLMRGNAALLNNRNPQGGHDDVAWWITDSTCTCDLWCKYLQTFALFVVYPLSLSKRPHNKPLLQKNLDQSMHSLTGCTCLTFLQCAFSNESSNWTQWTHDKIHCRDGHAPSFSEVHCCASDAHWCAWTASLIKNSPCSCGHFEMRLTSVGLMVPKL